MPADRSRRCVLIGASVSVLTILVPAAARPADPPSTISRGCPPERAQDGEVRLAILGDSGYGSGFAEWGVHGQDAIAARLNRLRLPPDLVLFLGDNIYWTGSAQLFKARFDDMYDPLVRDCKVHVALGNHDLKGCRAVSEYERWEACVQDLNASILADLKARYMRQGMDEAAAAEKAETEAAAETTGELAREAILSRKANCLPGDATAYEDVRPGSKTCNAATALEHAQFGFGSIEKKEPPAHLRQRYYSILWPLPKLTAGGAPDQPIQEVPTKPLVDVIVLDSNTLKVGGSVLASDPKAAPREDRLQLLFLRNSMSQWLPAPGESHRIWKLLAMHHPPYTPRACTCRMFGKCIGGHGDETELQKQLAGALEGLEPPDIVFTAHNHIYARSHPLDAEGRVVQSGTGGVRYFVSGGGGGPIYAIKGEDRRFAKALSAYHFVYLRLTSSAAFYWALDGAGHTRDSGCFEKGSNVDYPLNPDFSYDDALPPRCAPEGA